MPSREQLIPFATEAPSPPPRRPADDDRLEWRPGEVVKLPDPGDFTPRLGGPCGDCGSTVFDVVLCWREAWDEDGEVRRWRTVDARCPRCPLLSDRTARRKEVLGTLDLTTGEMTLIEGGRDR